MFKFWVNCPVCQYYKRWLAVWKHNMDLGIPEEEIAKKLKQYKKHIKKHNKSLLAGVDNEI